MINISGFLYYLSITKQDESFDKIRKIDEKYIINHLLISNLQDETIKILSNVFESSSVFWEYWDKRKKEYFDALLSEKLINKSILYSNYTNIAKNKSAFGKVAIDAMSVYFKKENSDEHKALLSSHDFFSIGVQIIDDIQDVVEDYNNDQFNWAYHKTILKLKKKNNFNFEKLNIQTIKKLFYLEGVSVDLYKKALQNFTLAQAVISEYNYTNWIKIIQKKEFETQNYINKIEGFLQIESTRKQLLNSKNNINVSIDVKNKANKIKKTSIQKSLKYLISEHEKDYNELKHLMYLDKIDGFNNKKNYILEMFFKEQFLLKFIVMSKKI